MEHSQPLKNGRRRDNAPLTKQELMKRLESLYRHLSDEGWHVHANTVAETIEIISK